MLSIDRIKFAQLFVFLSIVSIVCCGALIILHFKRDLFISLSIWKLIIISIAITAPILLLNMTLLISGNKYTPANKVRDFKINEESTAELMYVGAFLTSGILYGALGGAYFRSEDLKYFICSLAIGEIIFAIIIIICIRVFKRYFFYWKEQPPQI